MYTYEGKQERKVERKGWDKQLATLSTVFACLEDFPLNIPYVSNITIQGHYIAD